MLQIKQHPLFLNGQVKRKFYTLLLILFISTFLSAQNNIALKIPANASVVASINAGKLNQLMPVEEWEKTALGQKFKNRRIEDSTLKFNNIADLGINVNGSIYYFHTENDSMQYNCFMVAISDALKLDKLLSNKELIRLADGVRKSSDADSSGLYIWNNQQLLYVKGTIKDLYFTNSEVAQRHGLSYRTPISYNYKDSTATIVDEAVVIADTVMVSDEVVPADVAVAITDTAVIMYDEEIITDTTVIPYYEINDNDIEYYKDLSIKKLLVSATTATLVNELFYNTPTTSILSNTQYIKSLNANAIANVWVDKPMNFYYNLIPGLMMYRTNLTPLTNSFPTIDFGYKSFSGSLLMDEKQMSINTQIEMTDEMAAIQEKIADRKLNKRFYNYINTDSMLGYMTWALDTKAYLEQFPALMERTYGAMGIGIGSEEISLASEFFSWMIDEEAIGNMIKGDAMIMFNGVYTQQTTYTDYTYDDDFKATEVKKTKTETLPQFLMMLSSDENNLMRKLIKYGIKNKTVKAQGAIYEIDIPKSPMHFYFMNKDGIFFLSNSMQNMQQISDNTFKANLTKQEKKFMGNHSFTIYINPKNISAKIATTELGATENLSQMMNSFNKMGIVKMKVNALKDNITSANLMMEVPAGNSNSLTYFFSLFEGMFK